MPSGDSLAAAHEFDHVWFGRHLPGTAAVATVLAGIRGVQGQTAVLHNAFSIRAPPRHRFVSRLQFRN